MKHYNYHGAVQYPDLGADARLSQLGMLRIMQEAACEASCKTGYGPFDIERTGIAWIICGWKFRLDRRPPWGTPLTVETWPRTMQRNISDRDFLVYDGEGLVGAATSRWLLLDPATGRVKSVPAEVSAAYALDDSRSMEDELPASGRGCADAVETFQYTALDRDMDMFHHMNNLHYLSLAREALPADIAAQDLNNVEILYKRQIRRGDTVHFFYSCTDDKHLIEIKDSERKKTHALIWFF